MGNDIQVPDWLAVGAETAVYTIGGGDGRDRVRLATVAKVTATQVVVTQVTGRAERRFRLADFREVGESSRSGYGSRSELRRLDDPQVRKVRTELVLAELVHKITDAHNRQRQDPAALLDLIETQTARARRRVTELTGG